jgi:diaminopimelate epimerase
MNLSETAFITHDSKNPETYGLRWFTPGAEVNLCGHATIASAAFLSAHPDHENHPEYKFQTRSGELIAKKIQEGGKEIFELDFPAYVPKEIKSEVWQSDKKCSNSFEKALMSDAVGRDVGSGRVLSIKGVYEGGEDLIILIERSEHDPMEEWEVIPEGFVRCIFGQHCIHRVLVY